MSAPADADRARIAAPAVSNMLELIGGTPLVRLRHLPGPGGADVFVKCEQFNPGGSVKDRVALAMIERAEREGKLVPGKSVIVEPTSGNTGVGLALVAAVKRYRLILTMPDNMSIERRMLLKTYGAEVILTPAADVMHGAVERAMQLCAENPDYVMPQQFKNPANVEAHLRTTGPEIVAQLEEAGRARCDAFVAGRGHRRHHHRRGPGAAPSASPACGWSPSSRARARCCRGGRPGEHRIDGIGAGFVPEILDRARDLRGADHRRGGRAGGEAGAGQARGAAGGDLRRGRR